MAQVIQSIVNQISRYNQLVLLFELKSQTLSFSRVMSWAFLGALSLLAA